MGLEWDNYGQMTKCGMTSTFPEVVVLFIPGSQVPAITYDQAYTSNKKTSHSQTIWVLSLHHPIIFIFIIIIIIIIPSSHHPIIIIILLLLIPFPERYCIRYPKNSPPISGEKSG